MPSNSLINDYIAGAAGGIASLIVAHPFDTTKVQMQTRQTESPYKGTWDAIKNINKEGMVRGFFRGLGLPLISYGVNSSIFFGVYGNSLQWISNGAEKPGYFDVSVAGAVAGAASLILACPVDRVKVILQAQIPKVSEKNGTTSPTAAYFSGPKECMKHIYKEHGLKGFYRGNATMACRDIPGLSIYMVGYQYLYRVLDKNKYTDNHGVVASLMGGGMAGVICWVFIMPFDVIKSLQQSDSEGKYKGIGHTAKAIYESRGMKGFYAGFVINSLRSFPTNAVTFLAYSQSLKFLNSRSKKSDD